MLFAACSIISVLTQWVTTLSLTLEYGRTHDTHTGASMGPAVLTPVAHLCVSTHTVATVLCGL